MIDPMHDAVAELEVGVKDLAAEDRSGWLPEALSARVVSVFGLGEAIGVELVRVLAQWDGIEAWAHDGAVTAASWLRQQLPLTHGQARDLLRMASLYRRHGVVADALGSGRLSLAGARVLVAAESHREEIFADCVAGFVELAADLALDEFAQVVREWVEVVDDRAPFDESERRWRGTKTLSGTARTETFGSDEDLEIINAWFDQVDAPDAPDCPEGPRTRAQRRYDLVMDLFRRALADELGSDPDAIGGVDIVIDAHPDLLARLGLDDPPDLFTPADADPDTDPTDHDPDPDPTDHDSDPGAAGFGSECPGLDPEGLDLDGVDPDAVAGVGRGPRRGGGPLPRRRHVCPRCDYVEGGRAAFAFAALLVCSGWMRRVVRDPKTGKILDYGRERRLFSRAQRRALAIRDGGCGWPRCGRKPRWCQAHHIRPWEDGGLTNLDFGILLCHRHHQYIHRDGWTLDRDPTTGTVTVTSPDGRTFSERPHQRRRQRC